MIFAQEYKMGWFLYFRIFSFHMRKQRNHPLYARTYSKCLAIKEINVSAGFLFLDFSFSIFSFDV